MQLTPATAAHPAVSPAKDRIRPLMDPALLPLIPDAAFDARIGKGTVASEVDRAIRVRVEGDGPASERRIVPETTTAQALLDSKAGPAFEKLVRETAGVADAAKGKDNLRTYTIVPDEHAAKAVSFLNSVYRVARAQGAIQFSPEGTPEAERRAAQQIVNALTEGVPSQLAFSAGWNGGGDILIAPDVGRDLLATINAYAPAKGNSILTRPPKVREAILRDDWDTLVHETHHSVTPLATNHASPNTRIFEESVASIFGKRQRGQVANAAGARIEQVASRPTRVTDQADLGWQPWNRSHLPKPPKDLMNTAHARYVDGPAVVRDLLKMAGVDLRTTEGFDKAFDILQGRDTRYSARQLADAIIEHTGADPSTREAVVAAVKRSVESEQGAKLVADIVGQAASAD